MQSNDRIIKSYVWHGEKCFFVSTIERDSSAAQGGRYNETLVWDLDWSTNKRGKIIGGDSAGCRSLRAHFDVCGRLHETGNPESQED